MRLASARSLGVVFYQEKGLPLYGLFVLSLTLILSGFVTVAPAFADKYASIVIDYQTGRVLQAVDPDRQLYPASLTKMMTLYMAFEALKQRRISLNTPLPVSDHAAAMAPSRLNLLPGSTIRLEDAILALVTKSANDAAVAIAEGLGGTEENFARMMTAKARALGMHRSQFANASGLPNLNQLSTARDMAILGQALVRDFPSYYPYFNTRSFTYNNQAIDNHNRLLTSYDGADGIKTGYIQASGFNLVASAKRDGRRLVATVFGGKSAAWRNAHMCQLLDAGFANAARRESDPSFAKASPPLSATKDPPQAPLLQRTTASLAPAISPAERHTAAAPLFPQAAASATAPDLWTIQIGAFTTNDRAHSAAQEALRLVSHGKVSHGKIVVAASKAPGAQPIYRARIAGLAQAQARKACHSLTQQNKPCLALPP